MEMRRWMSAMSPAGNPAKSATSQPLVESMGGVRSKSTGVMATPPVSPEPPAPGRHFDIRPELVTDVIQPSEQQRQAEAKLRELERRSRLEAANAQALVRYINNSSDADRFVNAVIAREIIALNGGLDSLRIRHLHLGQFIELPNFDSNEYFAVDVETLRVFESSIHYEQILRSSLTQAYQRVGSSR